MSALRKLADIVQLGKNADVGALVDALLDLVQEKQEEAPDALGQLLSEIILSAYPKLSPETRRSVAERTGPSMLLSKPLALRLATDAIDIARPVLRASPVLSDHDLIDLVPDLGTAHLQEIAARQTIGTDLQGVIDTRAVQSEIEVGLESADLLFVEPSANGSSRQDQAPAGIDDLAVDNMDEQSDTTDQEENPAAGEPEAIEAFIGQEPAPDPIEDDPDVLALVDGVRSRRVSASDALCRLCGMGKQDALASLLSQLCNVPRLATAPFLLSADDKILAAACRTIDVDPDSYAQLLNWRKDRIQLTSMEHKGALKRYGDLSQKRALSILNQMIQHR